MQAGPLPQGGGLFYSENLHRKDLTPLERDEQIAEWIERTEKAQSEVSSQAVRKPDGGRPEGGIEAAARELGVNRMDARMFGTRIA